MTAEKKQFNAEVGKVLKLMIHSLYTNKDIFLRELISNSSDACDKLRYLAQSDSSLLGNEPELKIKISINKEQKELIIEDNGIGMSKEELVDNLGTIARSGTQSFMDQLSGDNKKDSQLIGQFGVGFYSSFMAADRVNVFSIKAGEKQAHSWYSDGQGEYTVAETDTDLKRGTRIILSLKSDSEDYLDSFRVKHIVKTYSDHISVPIYFREENGEEVQINSASALWVRNKNDITDDQYQEFYKSVSYSIDKPWLTMHNKNEGLVEFTNLIFIPSQKTFDLFHPDRKRRVKLYIKRVFITDENVDLIPQYLRFIRGVVDSEDLPLNISRENIQYNSTIEKIKNSLTKRIISEFKKKKDDEREEYEKFWNNFGAVLKEGLCEASHDSEKLMEVCLFYSAKQDKLISLDEYIASLPEDNDKSIFYLSGENPEKIKNSPQIEGFLAKGIDVLLFTDPVDDFWGNIANKYKDYSIKSATRADIDLNNTTKKETETKEDKSKEETNQKLIEFCKKTLSTNVKDVIISKKLTQSPSCLAVGEGDMDIRMERFLVEQKQIQQTTAKILEINPEHPILKTILSDIESKKENLSKAEDYVWLLFDQACINEGEPVKNAHEFSKRLIQLMQGNI